MLYSRCSLRGRPPAALDAGTASGKCRQIGLKHSRGWVLPSRAQGRQARPTAAVAVSGTHSEYRRRSPSSPAVQNGRARFRSSRLKHTPSESARPRWLSCRSNTVGGSLRTAILGCARRDLSCWGRSRRRHRPGLCRHGRRGCGTIFFTRAVSSGILQRVPSGGNRKHRNTSGRSTTHFFSFARSAGLKKEPRKSLRGRNFWNDHRGLVLATGPIRIASGFGAVR